MVDGYDLIRKLGCFGCHEINGYDGPDNRIGPDMRTEPNYYGAGLQLAYTASQRAEELSKLNEDLAGKVDQLEGKKKQATQDLMAVIQDYVGGPDKTGVFEQIEQLGREFAEDPARRCATA